MTVLQTNVIIFLYFFFGIYQTNCHNNYTVPFRWTFVNFTWPSSEIYKDAINSKRYIPENVVISGIKIYENKLYVALPQMRPGVPATFGYIDMDTASELNPLITPFPTGFITDPNDCLQLQSVQSMEIDEKGILWIIDGNRLSPFFTSCPAKLVWIDLKTNKQIKSYTFKNATVLAVDGFLNDIVIDTDGSFAYMTDTSLVDPGLVVYSAEENKAWKYRDSTMFGDKNRVGYEVGGVRLQLLAHVDGIALSPLSGKKRYVYYCPLTGRGLYKLDAELLNDYPKYLSGDWRKEIVFIGNKKSESDGIIIDNQGNLYFGLETDYSIAKWNISGGVEIKNAEIVAESKKELVWVDSFAFDNKGSLYANTNHILKFQDISVKLNITDEPIIRLIKMKTNTKSYLHPF